MLDKIELLERLAKLRRSGALTEDEFSREKSRVLASLSDADNPPWRSKPSIVQDETAEDATLDLGGFELEEAPSDRSHCKQQSEARSWNSNYDVGRRDPLEHYRASSHSGRVITVGAIVALLGGAGIFLTLTGRLTGSAGMDRGTSTREAARSTDKEIARSSVGATAAARYSANDAECTQYDAVSNEVARGQVYAYFAMYSPIESSTFSKLSQNGGLSITGFPRVSGKCNAAFRVQGVVDGTSYNVRLTCPIIASTPSDSSGKLAASEIDVQNCHE